MEIANLIHTRTVSSAQELDYVISEFIYADSLWFQVEPLGFKEYAISVRLDRKSALDYAIQRAREG